MTGAVIELRGIRIYALDAAGPRIRTAQDAVEIMAGAAGSEATLIAIPAERLGDDFFDLRTHIAGEIAQKFAIYGARVAIVGDIAARIAASQTLAAFVAETNRAGRLVFVADLEECAAG